MIGIVSIVLSVLVTIVLFTFARIVSPQTVSIWLFLAKTSGLLASILISWNFILTIRINLLEKLFGGLDRVYKVHDVIGKLGFILIVNHPIFLIINSLPFNTTKLYLLPSLTNLPYAFGIFGVYTLIILIILTIFVDLPYKIWKRTHEVMGLVIIFGGLHSLLIVSDTTNYLPLKIWIIGWSVVALISFVYKRYFYYLIKPKNNYVITNLIHEKSYLLIELTSTDPNKFIQFKAGQFAFFSEEKEERDEHPFSILEQDGSKIKIGTKIIGKFTIDLANLKVGTKLNVYGPFGTFANNMNKANEMVWISGGIGITPFLSMIKSLRSDQKATLIHSCQSDEPKIFTDMFIRYSELFPNFKFVINCSDIEGRLDENNVNNIVPLNKETHVYICGPSQMMEDLSNKLPKMGVLKKRIIFEDFNLK